MASRTKHGVISIRPAKGAARTRHFAAQPVESASQGSVSEPNINKVKQGGSFDFLRLPSELRNKIYQIVFSAAPRVIDLDPVTFHILHCHKLLALFAVSHQVHEESTYQFFSIRTFRLFPTYPGRYMKAKRPLLARLPTRYRHSITRLELRLGPNWNSPPRGWVVNSTLGLADCFNARDLKIFIECDPSDPVFNGFRKSEGYYERFSQNLLEGVLKGLPTIKTVEFDAWPSVKRNGNMILGLESVVTRNGKVVGWGAERGWDGDKTWMDAILVRHGAASVGRALVVHA